MLLSEVVATSAAVASSAGRLAKVTEIAALLARVPPDEVPIAVAFLSGDLTQRQIGVGYAALVDLSGQGPDQPGSARDRGEDGESAAADEATRPELTLTDTDATFEAIGGLLGPGSQAQRRSMLADLIGRATESERQFLFRLIAGDLRQGALEGIMAEAVAKAAGVSAAEIRRAHQLRGSLPEVARTALAAALGGADRQSVIAALHAFTLQVGQPIRPMLAASAPSIDAALDRISPAAIEWKIDGIRIQIHRDGTQVRVFTRTLDDITDRVPEIAEMALSLAASSAVIDGEAVALRPDGRPLPFQVTSARVASQTDQRAGKQPRQPVPLSAFLFDLLYVDGHSLIDEPGTDRFGRLVAIAPAEVLIPRIIASDPQEAGTFFAEAIERGHEGVVVKALQAPYRAGRRGSDWIKVKPRATLDLVILAAEWGHGRRTGLLSNLHLGARDPETGGFVMLGKTFKGLTDAMLTWQTARFLELADPPIAGHDSAGTGDEVGVAPGQERRYGVVRVRPELVAEIAFDGVQASRRYPGGVALRFARVLRYRPDKRADEADTIDAVRAHWPHEEPG